MNLDHIAVFGGLDRPSVLVLGLGESGLAMARWSARHGCTLLLADSRAQPPGLEQALALPGDPHRPHRFVSTAEHGAFPLSALGSDDNNDVQLIALSPGLSPLAEDIAPLLAAARRRGIPIWGELTFFSHALQALAAAGHAAQVIAITGTNGKTTTTALTGQLCARAGKTVAVAGNISPSMLDRLMAAIDDDALPQVWVLELSSFQLDTADGFEPDAAAVLNVTQDHLDWHGGFDAYAAAKFRIFGKGTRAVLNREDAHCAAWLSAREAEMESVVVKPVRRRAVKEVPQALPEEVPQALPEEGESAARSDVTADATADVGADATADVTAAALVSNASAVSAVAVIPVMPVIPAVPAEPRAPVTFGTDLPSRVGDFGIERNGGLTWLAHALNADGDDEDVSAAPVPTRGQRGRRAQETSIVVKPLMPVDALRIRGLHNASNALAALALCRAIGLSLAPLLHGLRDYRGEPHRVETIATLDGVDFIDDSKATNVGATVAALEGLEAPILLIAGGDGKGQDFSPLVPAVSRFCKAVMLIGRDAPLLRETLQACDVPMEDHISLEAATQAAGARAQSGDKVLLSPACASLDMFRNYTHRAEVFRGCVEEMAVERGVML